MAASAIAPWLKALLALFGGGLTIAAVASPSPKQAVQRQRLKRATVGARILPPQYRLDGPILLDGSGQIEGSDDSPDVIDPAAPAAALAEIARLDARWSAPVEAYRALHNSVPTQASIDDGSARIYRYPTRYAVLRATIDALAHSDPLAFKFGEAAAITDPTTNAMIPEWLEVVSLYAPTDADWAATADQVEDFYAARPSPSVLDYLGGLVDTAGDALALDWRGALKGAVRLSGMGSDGSNTLRTDARQISREEEAILGLLRRWVSYVLVTQKSGSVAQEIRTAQEALSGGGTPLNRGLDSLGGAAEIAARLRALPDLQPLTRSLSDDALALKAVLIARRWPDPGATPSGAWPSTAVGKAKPTKPAPAPDPNINDQSRGSNINDQSQGSNINDQSRGSNINSQYMGPQ